MRTLTHASRERSGGTAVCSSSPSGAGGAEMDETRADLETKAARATSRNYNVRSTTSRRRTGRLCHQDEGGHPPFSRVATRRRTTSLWCRRERWLRRIPRMPQLRPVGQWETSSRCGPPAALLLLGSNRREADLHHSQRTATPYARNTDIAICIGDEFGVRVRGPTTASVCTQSPRKVSSRYARYRRRGDEGRGQTERSRRCQQRR